MLLQVVVISLESHFFAKTHPPSSLLSVSEGFFQEYWIVYLQFF